VTADGERVELGLIDHCGTAVSLELPFEQAESVVMTLPQLLTHALKRRTGRPEARYVFSLGEWLIEDPRGKNCLIVTLKTTDGFEASFGIPFKECQALGWILKREADQATEMQQPKDGRVLGYVKLN
jgi:hypothetical protein